MAVINDYVTQNASSVVSDVDIAARFSGNIVKMFQGSFEVDSGDSDASVYRIGRISPHAIIKSVKFISDAITGATSYDVGVYKPLSLGGAVVDKDCLVAAADINAGKSAWTEMWVPTIANVGKPLYELAGKTEAEAKGYGTFDLAITANTVGSATGTISYMIEFIDAI